MLSVKRISLILFICLIPFLLFVAKPDLIGYDSYAFVNFVCLGESVSLLPGAAVVFSLLPCNFLVFKFLMFVVFFVSVLAIAFIGDLFDERNGWLAGVFVLTAPIWLVSFLKFEDDFLAFPFVFWGLYAVFRGVKEGSVWWKLLGSLIVLCGALFWKGTLIPFIGVSLLWFPLLLFVVPGVFIFFDTILIAFSTRFDVVENFPLIGFLMNGILLIGFLRTPKRFWLALGFVAVVSLFNSKFAFLLVPFLVPGFVLYFLKETEFVGLMKWMSVLVVLAFFVGSLIAVYESEPSVDFWSALSFAESKAVDLDKPFKNEWSYGYWVKFKGIDTNFLVLRVGIVIFLFV